MNTVTYSLLLSMVLGIGAPLHGGAAQPSPSQKRTDVASSATSAKAFKVTALHRLRAEKNQKRNNESQPPTDPKTQGASTIDPKLIAVLSVIALTLVVVYGHRKQEEEEEEEEEEETEDDQPHFYHIQASIEKQDGCIHIDFTTYPEKSRYKQKVLERYQYHIHLERNPCIVIDQATVDMEHNGQIVTKFRITPILKKEYEDKKRTGNAGNLGQCKVTFEVKIQDKGKDRQTFKHELDLKKYMNNIITQAKWGQKVGPNTECLVCNETILDKIEAYKEDGGLNDENKNCEYVLTTCCQDGKGNPTPTYCCKDCADAVTEDNQTCPSCIRKPWNYTTHTIDLQKIDAELSKNTTEA